MSLSNDNDVTHLYKFRALSESSVRFVEKTFRYAELYFARPTEFNDPFDCFPVASLDSSDREFADYLNSLHKRKMPHLSRADRRHIVAAAMKDSVRNHKSRQAMEVFRQGLQYVLNSAGVLSLSAKCDHVLMWSHYADSHRGICLRFSVSGNQPFFAKAQRVAYQADRPIINIIRDTPHEQSEKALLTKADFWSYEEEWRIVDHETGPGVQRFPPELLDGVILGARTSDEDRQKVVAWITQRKDKTEVLQARFSPEQFRIEVSAAI